MLRRFALCFLLLSLPLLYNHPLVRDMENARYGNKGLGKVLAELFHSLFDLHLVRIIALKRVFR